MKPILASLVLLIATSKSVDASSLLQQPQPAVSRTMVNHINQAQSEWKAHLSPFFKDKTVEHVKALCGTIIDPEDVDVLPSKEELFPEEFEFFSDIPIPETFDAREIFSDCADVIGHIRDQSNCGSCWAFSATEAFNDRLCIASNGEFQQLLSPQDTINCCGLRNCASMGCHGGLPGNAWKWFTTDGVVTGGDFDDNSKGSTCMPYQYHGKEATPKIECQTACSEYGYVTPYQHDKHKAESAYALKGAEAMQRDLMQYGSISAAFFVHDDFAHYQSGVYKPVEDSTIVGGHAIKLIGWGNENGSDYWLAVNSWTEEWGDNGTFKITRGENTCCIESLGVHGGHVHYYPEQ